MFRARRTCRKSLMNRRQGSVRFDTKSREFPPAYAEWLQLKEKQSGECQAFRENKYRKTIPDLELDAKLRLCEIKLLAELARYDQYDVPKDALQAISDALWHYHDNSKFTHWLFKPSITNRRNSDPQQEHLKALAVAFINQGRSDPEKKENRKKVAEHFGLEPQRKTDWESLARKGKLDVPDYTDYPVEITESVIKWAGQKYQGLLRKNKALRDLKSLSAE